MENNLNIEMLHALNTLPKAFFIWGIMEEQPLRPVEMEDKLKRHYPFLQHFTFLNRNNFNQYCHRSLKSVIASGEKNGNGAAAKPNGNGTGKQSPKNGHIFGKYASGNGKPKRRPIPKWRLDDMNLQPLAGYLLTKCVEYNINCETFLANGRNSCPESNLIRIRIMERLSQYVSQTVEQLSDNVNADTTTVDRHLVKMQAAGLVEYTVPPTDRPVRKRSVKNAFSRLTPLGQDVVRDVIRPMVAYMSGRSLHLERVMETRPTEEHLLKAMQMYEASLS